MEKLLDEYCEECLLANEKLHSLEKILRLLNENTKLAQRLARLSDFPLVLLEIITNNFYCINTGNFSEMHNYTLKVVLDIMQILVSHSDFKESFMELRMDFYLYPYVLTLSKDPTRISMLKLLEAILKDGIPGTMRMSEILPLLLKIAGDGSEKAQLVSLDILLLALKGNGLEYAVQTIDRFQAIDVVLNSLLNKALSSKNTELLKRLFNIYLRLCTKENVRGKLKDKLPDGLDSSEIQNICKFKPSINELRLKLLQKIQKSP